MAKQVVSQREAEMEAAERLAKTGNMAKLTLDSARSALSTARSQLEAAKAEEDKTEVRAPFDGLIDKVPVEKGSSVQVGDNVATILALVLMSLGRRGAVAAPGSLGTPFVPDR